MIVLLGLVVGFILGALFLDWSGGIAGAFTGLIIALAWRSRAQARAAQRARAVAATAALPLPSAADAGAIPPALASRLAAIEARLAALEVGAGAPPTDRGDASYPAGEPRVPDPTTVAERPAPTPAPHAAAPASPFAAPVGPAAFTPLPQGLDASGSGGLAATGSNPQTAAEVPAGRGSPPERPQHPLWAWFTSANALTWIGVVALFFGVGFLLTYVAEFVTIPVELKLAGVAAAGAAVAALGAWLARTRPAYGLSLEGAGAGILYLTTFAALRFYGVLPPAVAFVLLVLVAGLTVWLAVRGNSQPLAALAIAGGFLAPFLVARSPGEPALLFGYFLVLNGAILALAWVRAWRALNVQGFVFTFALALFWGERYYRPEHFATVEPFLVVFFLFYVAIAVLYARREALSARAPVDALLVFGVPLVGLALQAGLVRDAEFGVAYSALAMAAVYGVLWLALHRRPEPGLALLARAFFLLAILLATVAIPFAADPHWTSAWWALESAAVFWIGCRQRQPLARGLALLLQIGAALVFASGHFGASERPFLNATYFGSVLIALAALATACVADRHRESLAPYERALIVPLVLWGAAWWFLAGSREVHAVFPAGRSTGNPILAYAVASVACALLIGRGLQWPRIAWFGAGLLPLMALSALSSWDRQHTTLLSYGWLIWPAAWIVHWAVLRAAEALRQESVPRASAQRAETLLRFAHAASAIALVAWVAWEASEWVGRAFPVGTVWVACAAAVPAILYLFVVVRLQEAAAWPFAAFRDAYATRAGMAVAALLGVWFLIVNVISPGSPAPLPFVPIANPLDITLFAALAALFVWTRATLNPPERVLYAWFGAALFVLVNAMVFRAVHHWLDVAWRGSALLASKPLQAALTVTWTATALPLMLLATRRAVRPLWMVGAGLLAVTVIKLFVLDLAALSGLPRVVAFLGAGVLLLAIAYLAPMPPGAKPDAPAPREAP